MNETFTDKHPFLASAWGLTLIVVIIIVLTVVGVFVGQAIDTSNAKHQGVVNNINSHNIRNGYSNQQSLRDEITQRIGDVDTINVEILSSSVGGAQRQSLEQQRYAVVGIVCHDADQITGDALSVDQRQFVAQNCAAGNVSPSSHYAPKP